jgi:hypothetical protein
MAASLQGEQRRLRHVNTFFRAQAGGERLLVMNEEPNPVIDLSQLRAGETVLVQSPGRFSYAGVVDEVMPQFSLVWVREARTAERKLVLVGESYIYRFH